MIRTVFDEVLGVKLPNPFPAITYAEAMSRYGSDKPDLRVSLELIDVTDLVRDVEFKVFKGATEMKDGRVVALRVPGGGEMPRSRDRRLHRVRQDLRCEGAGVHQGQREGKGTRRAAESDREEPA